MAHINLDFERRQHLTNWLIKSGPHMPKVVIPGGGGGLSKKGHHHVAAIGGNSNAMWLPQGAYKQVMSPAPCHGMTPLASSQVFSGSQTNLNLPLQIFTTPYDGHKPKLRRFNSHDTSANMFSVTEFENARKNPAAVAAAVNHSSLHHHGNGGSGGVDSGKQHKPWYDSMNRNNNHNNSLNDYYSTSRDSSGGQSRPGGGGGGGGGVLISAGGGDEEVAVLPQETMPIDRFLQKNTLPKVVRVFSPNDSASVADLHNNSSSNTILSKLSDHLTASNRNNSGSGSGNNQRPEANDKGRLMFIYRHIPNRKIFHAHNTKANDKRRSIKIPQELKGKVITVETDFNRLDNIELQIAAIIRKLK